MRKQSKNKNKSLYWPYLKITYVNVIISAEKWTKIKWIVNNITSCRPLEMCHRTSGETSKTKCSNYNFAAEKIFSKYQRAFCNTYNSH